MNRLRLYHRLPHGLRQSALIGLSIHHHMIRHGQIYTRFSETLERSERDVPQRRQRMQSELLLRLLREARSGTEYYGDQLARWSDDDLRDLARTRDLGTLPLLERGVLKEETPRFSNRLRRTAAHSSTSGSTGSPLVVAHDRESLQMQFATKDQQRRWAGIAMRARSVRLSGRQIIPAARQRPPYWMHNPLERQLLVSTYHLREDHLPRIVARIRRFAPVLIDGYATAIQQIARYCASTGESVPSLRAAITTAETLSDELRGEIETGLRVQVLDFYGASEGVSYIQQCEWGTYHLREETGIFEFLRQDGRPAAPGEEGEIVVTSLFQWKVPLIRYRTGDLARLPPGPADTPCPCGRTLPKIEAVLGRLEDQVFTRDGRWLGMFSYRTLKSVSGIREAQIVQKSPEHFHIRIVLDGAGSPAEVERGVTNSLIGTLGYVPRVSCEFVDSIPRGANGKLRSVIREFQPAR